MGPNVRPQHHLSPLGPPPLHRRARGRRRRLKAAGRGSRRDNERILVMTAAVAHVIVTEIPQPRRIERRPSGRRRRDSPTASAWISHTDIFAVRCEIVAILVAAGDFHDGIDALQAEAVANNLIDTIGQDAVQEMMVDVFSPDEPTPEQDIWPPPNWSEYGPQVIRGERRRDEHGAPQVTVEALVVVFREGGLAGFERPENQKRLSRFSSAQRDELRRRIKKLNK